MRRLESRWSCLFIIAVLAGSVSAAEQPDRSLLTVERIFDSHDFAGQTFSARWAKDGSGYLTLESSQAAPGGRDIVLHDAQSGEAKVLVSAAQTGAARRVGAAGHRRLRFFG